MSSLNSFGILSPEVSTAIGPPADGTTSDRSHVDHVTPEVTPVAPSIPLPHNGVQLGVGAVDSKPPTGSHTNIGENLLLKVSST